MGQHKPLAMNEHQFTALVRRKIRLQPGWSAPGFSHDDRQTIKTAAVEAAFGETMIS